MGRLWSGLAGTLTRLEGYAAEPDRLDDDEAVAALRRLQYTLHAASERAYGIAPPRGTEQMHAELAASLEGARDATGEVVEAVEAEGAGGADVLVHEWRGALFRVRLARLRLAGPRQRPAVAAKAAAQSRTRAAVALALALIGGGAFTAGASTGLWPVWAAGIAAVCASFIAYKP